MPAPSLKSPKLLLPVLLLALPATAGGQTDALTQSRESLRELQRFQDQLADFESEFGPFDHRLLEPLGGLISRYRGQGDYERVAELQTRQLAIMRTTLGFEHPDLVPVVRGMIEVQQALGNWGEVSDHLEHIRYLVAANHGAESEELLHAMANQADWLLARFYLDEQRRQSNIFLDARDLYRDIYRQAEDIHGKDDPALYPWYYKRAYSLALLVQLLNTEDGFAGIMLDDLVREDGPGRLEQGLRGGVFNTNPLSSGRRIVVLNGDGVLGEGYLRQGLGFINDIRDIAEEQGDLEAQAMAELYRGDFHVLMERGSGRRQYREAREQLLEAGIPLEQVDELFSQPIPLPVPEFHARFAGLLAYQRSLLDAPAGGFASDSADEPASDSADEPASDSAGPASGFANSDSADDPTNDPANDPADDSTDGAMDENPEMPESLTYIGSFYAWHENARAVLKPVSADPLLRIGLPQVQVDLSFNLSTRGHATGVEVLGITPDDRRARREASRAIREIQFRPAYEGDRAHRFRGAHIRYLFARR